MAAVGRSTTAARPPQPLCQARHVAALARRWASSATACAPVGVGVHNTQVWASRWAAARGGLVWRPGWWARCWAGAVARSRAVPGCCGCVGRVAPGVLTTTPPGPRGGAGCPRPLAAASRWPSPRRLAAQWSATSA